MEWSGVDDWLVERAVSGPGLEQSLVLLLTEAFLVVELVKGHILP